MENLEINDPTVIIGIALVALVLIVLVIRLFRKKKPATDSYPISYKSTSANVPVEESDSSDEDEEGIAVSLADEFSIYAGRVMFALDEPFMATCTAKTAEAAREQYEKAESEDEQVVCLQRWAELENDIDVIFNDLSSLVEPYPSIEEKLILRWIDLSIEAINDAESEEELVELWDTIRCHSKVDKAYFKQLLLFREEE